MIWIFWQLHDISTLGGIYNQSEGFWRKEIIDALLPGEKWAYNAGNDDETESSFRELIILLKNPEWKIRKNAALSLRDKAPEGKSAIPALITALKDEEWQVRQASAQALSHFGPASQPAVQLLIESLKDREWQVRYSAAEALTAIGEALYPAIPMLIETLGDAEWQVRRQAAEALTAAGKASHQAIPELIKILQDDEWPVRKSAIWAIIAIAPEDMNVQKALRGCHDDPEDIVRKAAKKALTRINANKKLTIRGIKMEEYIHILEKAIEQYVGLPVLNLIKTDPTHALKIHKQEIEATSINSGKVVLDNIGSQYKLKYTVMGDMVNMASRMESLTLKYKINVILSGNTQKLLTINFNI